MTKTEVAKVKKAYEKDIEYIVEETRKAFRKELQNILREDPELNKVEDIRFEVTTHVSVGKFE